MIYSITSPKVFISYLLLLVLVFNPSFSLQAQCKHNLNHQPKSQRLSNYKMDLVLDADLKKVDGHELIEFTNHSPTDTIFELRFYMYLNSFKNSKSTWMKGANLQAFGRDLTTIPEEEWGWIEIIHIEDQHGKNLTPNKKYIQPDDGNLDDESVLMIPLQHPILPLHTAKYEVDFISKLPRTIARSGWAENDFFLWVHWYPKLGVWETDQNGKWNWNCHQFMRMTEFYGEFGTYEVTIKAPEKFKIGASGCILKSYVDASDQTINVTYSANDVIDFAWSAYPHFEIIKDKWNHVDITLLSCKEHRRLQPRFMNILKHALQYMTENVGPYPYETITVLDPPFLALRNGFMEYPTFITGGSFSHIPKGIRTIESLIVHEFCHQYFMAILANNEKEEPWMDEGFVTYYEDLIMEDYFGKKSSLIELLGLKIGNSEVSRAEYVNMENHREYIIAQPGWKFKRYAKSIIYSKTATFLRSFSNILGHESFRKMMKSYYDKFKFSHPRGIDFFNHAKNEIELDLGKDQALLFEDIFKQAFYTTAVCDFAVKSCQIIPNFPKIGLEGSQGNKYLYKKTPTYQSIVTIEQLGDFVIPVDVEIIFEDGKKINKNWDGNNHFKSFTIDGRVSSVHIDPAQKILFDIDLNNNSYTTEKSTNPMKKYSWKAMNWLHNILQSSSIFM